MGRPPKKTAGQAQLPRRINGLLLDVDGASSFIGCTEKTLRSGVARREVPFRRLGGRLVFLRSELERFVQQLEGCGLEEALRNAQHALLDGDDLYR